MQYTRREVYQLRYQASHEKLEIPHCPRQQHNLQLYRYNTCATVPDATWYSTKDHNFAPRRLVAMAVHVKVQSHKKKEHKRFYLAVGIFKAI